MQNPFRRSLLYVPGDRERMLDKIPFLECDSVIVDLEDAVAPAHKFSARETVRDFLRKDTGKKEIFIRVNDAFSPYFAEDIKMAAETDAEGIVLPKADKKSVAKAESVLDSADRQKKLKLILLIETALGLLELKESIAESRRVIAIQFGAEDYTRDLEISRTVKGEEIQSARQWIALVCKGYNIQAIDTPFTDYKDERGLVSDIENAKQAGMKAKTCIHPAQLKAVNQYMAPGEAEIRFARLVVAESEKPENRLAGAFSLQGKMVDAPVIARARRILERAQMYEQPDEEKGSEKRMDLRKKADELRLKTFEIITDAGGGHYGGSLSAIEILTVLYYDVMRHGRELAEDSGRDRFVLCKGHAGPPLYAILADCGYICADRLKELDQNGGSLPKHVDRKKVQGIEYSSGPLGQGLSVACGMAASLKDKYKTTYVYALLGDGECDEGQVWEAAMMASQYHLDRLIAVVDYNKAQIDGRNQEVMGLEPFTDKWRAFGWNVFEVDGHDVDALKSTFAEAKASSGKPCVIIAHTKKGKGISFMEDNYLWHSGKITEEQYRQGLQDLGVKIS